MVDLALKHPQPHAVYWFETILNPLDANGSTSVLNIHKLLCISIIQKFVFSPKTKTVKGIDLVLKEKQSIIPYRFSYLNPEPCNVSD